MSERIAQAQEKVTQVAHNLRGQKPVETVVDAVNERLPKFLAMKSKVGDFISGLKTEAPVPPTPEDLGGNKGTARVKEAMGRASETLSKVKSSKIKENTVEKVSSVKDKAAGRAGPVKEAVLNKVSSVKEAVGTGATKTVEWFNDEEEGTKRKAVTAGVLGVATVGAAFGVYRKRQNDEKQRMQDRVDELEARLPKDGHKTTSESIAEMRSLMQDTIKKGPIYRFGDKLDDDEATAASPTRTREAADRARAHLAGNRDGDTQTQPAYRDSLREETTAAMDVVAEEREKRLNENQPETTKQRLAHNLGMTAFAAWEIAKTHKRAAWDRRKEQPQPADPNTAPTEPLPVPPPAPTPETTEPTS